MIDWLMMMKNDVAEKRYGVWTVKDIYIYMHTHIRTPTHTHTSNTSPNRVRASNTALGPLAAMVGSFHTTLNFLCLFFWIFNEWILFCVCFVETCLCENKNFRWATIHNENTTLCFSEKQNGHFQMCTTTKTHFYTYKWAWIRFTLSLSLTLSVNLC
jgi:hypothetical protein